VDARLKAGHDEFERKSPISLAAFRVRLSR
jgi:hypothetical protein